MTSNVNGYVPTRPFYVWLETLARDKNIRLEWGAERPWTDGQTLYLPHVPLLQTTEAEAVKGYFLHEVGHCQNTDFALVRGQVQAQTPLHFMWNVIEDIRMEAAMARCYPGFVTLMAPCYKYCDSIHAWDMMPAFRAYGITAISLAFQELGGIQLSVSPEPEVQELIRETQHLLRQAPGLPNCLAALMLAKEILVYLEDLLPSEPLDCELPSETESNPQADQGSKNQLPDDQTVADETNRSTSQPSPTQEQEPGEGTEENQSQGGSEVDQQNNCDSGHGAGHIGTDRQAGQKTEGATSTTSDKASASDPSTEGQAGSSPSQADNEAQTGSVASNQSGPEPVTQPSLSAPSQQAPAPTMPEHLRKAIVDILAGVGGEQATWHDVMQEKVRELGTAQGERAEAVRDLPQTRRDMQRPEWALPHLVARPEDDVVVDATDQGQPLKYQFLRDKVALPLVATQHRLEQELSLYQRTSWQQDPEGELRPAWVPRFYTSAYQELPFGTLARQESQELRLLVLVDCSGSMSSNMSLVREAVCILGESFDVIPSVQLAVAGFTTTDNTQRIDDPQNLYNRDTPMVITKVVDFDTPAYWPALTELQAIAATPLNDAMWWALQELEQHAGARLLVVVTDGYPSGDRAISTYDAILAVQEAETLGIGVLGLGIQVDLAHIFTEFVEIEQAQDIPTKFLDALLPLVEEKIFTNN